MQSSMASTPGFTAIECAIALDAKPLIASSSIQFDRGTISIQSESHPTEFRKIELRRLK